MLPGAQWRDYDGDEAYADYAMTLDPQTEVVSPVQTAAYLPGVGQIDMQTGWVSYLHGDQIGSRRAVSGSVFAGSPPERVTRRLVYTAFGEKVYDEGSGSALPPEDTRYQYAGAWGYESDAGQNLPFLHVGYRYYDPSTGRFVQRDPIGIRGGLNIYAYVSNSPLGRADSAGLLSIDDTLWLIGEVDEGATIAGGVISGLTGDLGGVLEAGIGVYGGRCVSLLAGNAVSACVGVGLWGLQGAIYTSNALDDLESIRNRTIIPAVLRGGADEIITDPVANRHIDSAGRRTGGWAAGRNMHGQNGRSRDWRPWWLR